MLNSGSSTLNACLLLVYCRGSYNYLKDELSTAIPYWSIRDINCWIPVLKSSLQVLTRMTGLSWSWCFMPQCWKFIRSHSSIGWFSEFWFVKLQDRLSTKGRLRQVVLKSTRKYETFFVCRTTTICDYIYPIFGYQILYMSLTICFWYCFWYWLKTVSYALLTNTLQSRSI